jgi:hypothetical protein
MTLNVLRDDEGNMMSLVKYWNGNHSNKPSEPNLTSLLGKMILGKAQLGED